MSDQTTEDVGVDGSHKDPEHPEIFINDGPYRAPERIMTGEQLRHLGQVPADYVLWEEVPGGDDRKIEPHDEVHLHEGQRFFTVPKLVNPGSRGA